ncbi:MAG: DUF1640 domain-containing protein [Nitrospirae bacterium]|nr:DUF1640 domain-containing protein [Nitrospirota bacterium]MBF0542717.1 DUF1640 domain-containing protein [Nitrospirota bacterium]
METTIDTYVLIKRLKEAGMPEPQAVVMSDVIKQVEASRSDVLATKSDVQLVRAEIQQVKTELKAEIQLIRWMLGVLIAGMVSLVLKAFFIP